MSKNKKLIILFSCLGALTVLVLLNSILFTVRTINAQGIDNYDTELNTMITSREVHGIGSAANIFFLNDSRIIQNIHQNLAERGHANVEVKYIERHFPNRLTIHFRIVSPIFYVVEDGYAYVFACNLNLIERVEVQNVPHGIVRFDIEGDLLSAVLGTSFRSSVAADMLKIEAIVYVFERLPFAQTRPLTDRFSSVRFIGNFKYVYTVHGVRFQLEATANFINHFLLAHSLHEYFIANPAEFLDRLIRGTIIVIESSEHGLTAHWTA